jgi:hypothetical protein
MFGPTARSGSREGANNTIKEFRETKRIAVSW